MTDRWLPRYAGNKPKRRFVNGCAPCRELIPELGCRTLCCRLLLVPISQEDLDEGLERHPPFLDVLKRAPEGPCHYLDRASGACTVWERRPLACRIYDCRTDLRFPSRRRTTSELHIEALPERCHGCGRDAQLIYGARQQCDDHVVCGHCGAPWRLEYLPDNTLRLIPVQAGAETRARYRLASACYRQQWQRALAELESQLPPAGATPEQLRQRAVLWAELERFAEAEAALRQLAAGALTGVPAPAALEAALDLAWLHTRTGDDPQARALVEAVLPRLAPAQLMRAHLLLGNIAARARLLAEAAQHYLAADRHGTVAGVPDPVASEHLASFTSSDPAAEAAVQRARMLRSTPDRA